MLNHITLMGRLTRDPELRYTQTGTAVASFSLAVDRDFGSRDGGERQTDFIDIVAWRNTAEFVSKYFGKGQMAAVSGRLQIRDWQDKDGNKRRSAEVVADNVYFADSKKSREEGEGYSQGGNYQNQAPSQNRNYPQNQSSYSQAPRNDSYNSYSAPGSSAFSELDDGDDGELPF